MNEWLVCNKCGDKMTPPAARQGEDGDVVCFECFREEGPDVTVRWEAVRRSEADVEAVISLAAVLDYADTQYDTGVMVVLHGLCQQVRDIVEKYGEVMEVLSVEQMEQLRNAADILCDVSLGVRKKQNS